MNNLIKIFITIIAIPNLLIYPFQSFVNRELQEYNMLFEQFYNYLAIAMLLGAIVVISQVWRIKTKTVAYKIIWTLVLLYPFQAISVPFYMWFMHPKVKNRAN